MGGLIFPDTAMLFSAANDYRWVLCFLGQDPGKELFHAHGPIGQPTSSPNKITGNGKTVPASPHDPGDPPGQIFGPWRK